MLLDRFKIAQLGPGLAASVCGRMLGDNGATVTRIGAGRGSPLQDWLNAGSNEGSIETADLIVVEGSPATLLKAGWDPTTLRSRNRGAAIVLISPFGQTGPRAEEPATDLTLAFASGIARLLTGQVDDLAEPPMAPAGQQAAFIGGLAAACAGMHAALLGNGAVVDVSIQQALATLAITELTRASQRGVSWRRKREADGNGATVCILPAKDGYAAISPREEKQWAAWVAAMGDPDWASDPRFARKPDRVANWDALHALMSDWSRRHDKHQIATLAQGAHVPSFPLLEVTEHLESAQLRHRGFFRDWNGIRMPNPPLGVSEAPCAAAAATAGPLPLSGVRVLDFSWVIAGPTTTRYLAAMGAEVIKVEAPNGGDPGRASELHTVLGQGKKTIVLDLKKPEAVAIARDLAARSDVLIENFATGVMDRLGLGAEALRAVAPGLIYVSASGLGRTGPEARAVAYGTLLQCYAGFAGLNRHSGAAPRVGMAWLDPMCGLMLAFAVAAALWRRRQGAAARVDFSMIEAMLWTMADPLLRAQGRETAAPAQSVLACAGDDAWVAAQAGDVLWDANRPAADIARDCQTRGIPAAALVTSADLVHDPHLGARGFWADTESGLLPGLPWQASFPSTAFPARPLGADTESVLADVLGLAPEAIATLREARCFG